MTHVQRLLTYIIATAAFVLLVLPMSVAASPVLRTGESVTLGEDQLVEGDFYTGAGTVTVSGGVAGDLIAAGGTVTVNGSLGEDALLAGGTVQIHAPVGDDLRAAGGEVTIAEGVAGDVFVFAGVLRVLSTARIEGDVIFFGGEADIAGDVGGSIKGQGEAIRIDGVVGGDIDVHGTLELSDRADVAGNVTYVSDRDIARAPGSVVVGEVTRSDIESSASSRASAIGALPLLIMLFSSLVLLLLFRTSIERLVEDITHSFGTYGLIGLGVFVGMPIAAILLMISVLGLLIGLITLLGYIILLLAAWALSGILLGAVLARIFTKNLTVNLMWTFIGVIAVQFATLIPLIGPLLMFVVMLIVLGGIATRLYKAFK